MQAECPWCSVKMQIKSANIFPYKKEDTYVQWRLKIDYNKQITEMSY